MNNGENILGPEQESSVTSDDYEAGNEAALIADGQLAEAARRSEHRRRERFRDVLSSGRIILAWVLLLAVILFIAIMGWHYLGPESLAWMSPEQIDQAETAIAGSAISLIILLLRRYL